MRMWEVEGEPTFPELRGNTDHPWYQGSKGRMFDQLWDARRAGKWIWVIGHPGGATSFISKAHKQLQGDWPVAHETFNPKKRAKYFYVISSYNMAIAEQFDLIWHYVREPIKTVYSAAKIWAHNPGGHYLLLNKVGLPTTDDMLGDMLKSVIKMNAWADEHATRRFRAEDQKHDIGHAPNTHNPDPPSWQRLYENYPAEAEKLREQSERYGYDTSGAEGPRRTAGFDSPERSGEDQPGPPSGGTVERQGPGGDAAPASGGVPEARGEGEAHPRCFSPWKECPWRDGSPL